MENHYTMKLFLVDGHSLAYRAFFAMPPLTNSKGQATQAVLGVANMVFRILKEEKPTHMIVFFDREIPRFRLDAYPEYKAQREKAPEDFSSQLPLIKGFFKAIGVQVYDEPGYEADDWIAAAVKQAEQIDNAEIQVFSGDLDLLQLVTPKTTVLASRKGISDLTRYNVDEVRKRFSLEPTQLSDYKALVGDASDNIKGVKGLGEKGATKLLKEYGTVENLLEHVNVLPPKTQSLLSEAGNQIRMNKALVLLRHEAPLQFKAETCVLSPYDPETLRNFLEQMEFNTLMVRLGLAEEAKVEYAEFQSADSESVIREAIEKFRKSSEAGLLIWPASEPFATQHFLALDLPEGRWVFPPEFSIKALKQLTEIQESKKIFVYDWKTVYLTLIEEKIKIPSWTVHDVLLTGWLINSGRTSPDLDSLSREHLQIPLPSEIEKDTPPAPVIATWSSVLRKLGSELQVKIEALGMESVYQSIELPLIPVLARME